MSRILSTTAAKQRPHSLHPVSILGALLSLVVLNLLVLNLDVSPIPANLVAVSLVLILSFISRRIYTKAHPKPTIVKRAALFLLVSTIGLYGIQSGILYVLLGVWSEPFTASATGLLAASGAEQYISSSAVSLNGAKAIAALLSLAWTTFMYKTVVFSKKRGKAFDRLGDWLAYNRRSLLLAVIIALGAVLRFWQLGTLPPGLHSGEASDGHVASAILEGNLPPASELYFYLQAVAVFIFGNEIIALRIVPAIIGVTSVVFVYLAGRDWFNQRVGLVAALLLAVSPWSLHLSRVGDEAVLGTLIVPLGMWLFARAIQSNHSLYFVGTGIFSGMLVYAGVPLYAFMILLLAVLLYGFRRYHQDMDYLKQPFLIVGLSALLTILPLLIYANVTQNMGALWRRFDLWTNLPASWGELPLAVAEGFLRTLGMFHFSGSNDPLYNLAGEPHLGALVGILFVLGIALAFRRFRRVQYFALLVLFAVALLPNILLLSEAPSIPAGAMLVPVITLFAAVGLSELISRWHGVFPRNILAKQVAGVVILIALTFTVLHSYERYFLAWSNAPATFEAYQEHLTLVAQDVRADDGVALIVVADEEQITTLDYLLANRDSLDVSVGTDITDQELTSGEVLLVGRGSADAISEETFETVEEVSSPQRPHEVMYTRYRVR